MIYIQCSVVFEIHIFKILFKIQSMYFVFEIHLQKCILYLYFKYCQTALVLLDLSAAFDTIDHSILMTRLANNFGVTGTALSLLSSYLSGRAQSVPIGNTTSPSSPLISGVPQGSVLGPLFFCLYTSPLSQIFSNSPVFYHLYADDTQLYILSIVQTMLIIFPFCPSFLTQAIIGLFQIVSV